MSYTVNITDAAEADLRSIFEYIAFELRSIENAVVQLNRLEREINSLSEMPERYRKYDVEPWLSRGMRIVPVDNYCVFYITNEETHFVDIIRVLYGGRDFAKALGK